MGIHFKASYLQKISYGKPDYTFSRVQSLKATRGLCSSNVSVFLDLIPFVPA